MPPLLQAQKLLPILLHVACCPRKCRANASLCSPLLRVASVPCVVHCPPDSPVVIVIGTSFHSSTMLRPFIAQSTNVSYGNQLLAHYAWGTVQRRTGPSAPLIAQAEQYL